ncbi:hypothetical protein BDN72DRAFT_778160, partial [Pluteus cervinus]
NRWFLVEFIPAAATKPGASTLDGKSIHFAIKQSTIANFGDTGWGAIGLSLNVKYYSPMTNMCIIRIGRDQHQIVLGALTLLTSIDGVRWSCMFLVCCAYRQSFYLFPDG